MIIKEFRVVVPMSVEEYQIGQLYTIQKKSRLETTGAGSGVEIIENRPYESKTEKGQYTLKVYHVDERLPAGLKTLSKLLFPKSALLFEEESWNCYPYTRTKYSHKFFKSFYVDIESRYLADLGQSDNVFNLSSSELAQRSIDYIDIVNDPISPNEYKTETDPQLFVSAKTNRGPMHPQWLEEMRSSASSQPDPSQSITGKKTRSLLNGRPVEYMCCYKLCRIECAFWGCQSRVEKLVSESVIRHMVFLSHREAWCWQDEYYGLTMQDVRELENETQRYLNAKMRNNSLMEEDLASLPNQSKKNSTEVAVAASSSSSSHTVSAAAASKPNPTSPTSSTSTIKGDTSSSSIKSSQSPQASPVKQQQQPQQQQQTSQPQPVTTNNLYGKKTSIVSVAKSIETDSGDDFEDFPSSNTNTSPVFDQMNHRNNPNIYFKNDVGEEEEFVEQNYSGEEEDDMNEQVPFGNSSDEDRASQHSDEFFDAISQVSFNFSTNTTELDNKSTHTVNLPTTLGPTTKKKKPVKLVIKDSKQSEQQNKQQTAVTVSNNSTTKQTPQTQTITPTKNIELSRSIFNNSTTSSSSSNSSASASSAPVNRTNTATTNVAPSKASSSSSSTVTAMKPGPSQPNRSGINASANRSNIDVLLLVVHGGNVTCTDTSKQSDFSNFKSTMESVIKSNYAHLQGRIAYRLVPCDSICKDVLVKLAALSPIVNQQTCSLNNVLNDSDDFAETSAAVFSVHESLPFNTLPLLATANSLQYRNHLSLFIRQCNKVYQEFLQSIGGFNADGSCAFNGQVVIVGDSLGSILAYDALTQINVAGSTRASDEHLSSSASSVVHPTTTTAAPTTPNSGGGGGGDNNRNRSISPRRKESSSSSSTGGGGSAGIGHTNPIISINDEERRMSLLQQQDTVSLEASTHRKHHHHHHHHHSKNHHRSPSNKMIRNLSDSEFVTPTTSTASFLTPNSPSQLLTAAANDLSRSSSMTCVDERLEFQVAHFFIFGSPLGLVLAYRKIGNNQLEPPIGSHIYNLFHLTDPIAVRIEPLLCKQFKYIDPCMVPRYSKFPLGDGLNLSLDHYIVKYGNLFDTKNLISDKTSGVNSNNDSPTIAMNNPSDIYFNTANSWLTSNNLDQLKSLQKILYTKKNWWGDNRIDYVLYAPEKITNLPRISLPYIFHSCYWESTDVVAFALRMIFRHEFEAAQAGQASINDMYKAVNASPLSAMAVGGRGGGGGAHGHSSASAGSKEPVEKFQKRLNRVKLRNLSANHRANDVIVLEDKEQILTAKFSYGPLDFALSGEKVDIFITSSSSSSLVASSAAVKGSSSSTGVSSVPQTPAGEWRLLASAVTDSHGRLKYELPKDKRLVLGMYHIKCVVKCDHTFVDFQMAVLPVQTEAVVFSIDGSFAANISFSGTDPKVRAGAVDVVRYWQDLGYLIIYITARPDIQHYKVTNWLAQHNFPLGMVFFSEGICRDPLRQKTENLRSIVIGNQLKLQAGYGSPKDIPMYASLGVAANRIFIIGKAKSKYLNHAVFLQDGYASHLTYLQNPNTGCRQATGNARLIIKKATFTVKHNTLFSNPTSSLVASSTTGATSEVVATKPSSLVIDPTKQSKSKLQTPPPGTIIPPLLPSQQQQQSTTNSMSSKSSLHDSMRSTHSESSARTGNHSNSLRQTPSSAPIPNSININSATTTSSTTTSSNNNNNDNTHRHLAFPFHA